MNQIPRVRLAAVFAPLWLLSVGASIAREPSWTIGRGDDAGSASAALLRTAGSGAAFSAPAFEAAPQTSRGASSELKSLSGTALLAGLHDQSGRGYRMRSYGEAGSYMFATADNIAQGNRRGVVDTYSCLFVAGAGPDRASYKERGDQNGDGFPDAQGMNIEHTWPQSFFRKELPMRSDLHMLQATLAHPNGMRGSYPLGDADGRPQYSNNGGARLSNGVFEPPDCSKGKVARAILYFYTRYYDRRIYQGGFDRRDWSREVDSLLRWNRQFPPDDNERRRNDLIEDYQGNRNPYVDDPGLADRVGAEAFKSAGRDSRRPERGPSPERWRH